MKGISVSTCFNYDIDFSDQLELIHKAGFSHVSIGTNYSHSGILESDNVIKISEIVSENNLLIDTIHGCSMSNPDFPLLMEVSMEHSKFKNAEQFLSITYSEAKKIYNTINK